MKNKVVCTQRQYDKNDIININIAHGDQNIPVAKSDVSAIHHDDYGLTIGIIRLRGRYNFSFQVAHMRYVHVTPIVYTTQFLHFDGARRRHLY